MTVYIIFGILALLTVASAVMVILQRNPIYSALYLIFAFFSMAGLFLLLGAEFIAVIQVVVYAGAVMVLFIFVIMLLNLEKEPVEVTTPHKVQIFLAGLFGLILFATLGFAVNYGIAPVTPKATKVISFADNTREVAKLLFTKYLLPFEIASVLLLAAIVGAVYLSKRQV